MLIVIGIFFIFKIINGTIKTSNGVNKEITGDDKLYKPRPCRNALE
jgi:hypothetical protein